MPPALQRTSSALVTALCSLLLTGIVPSVHGETPAGRDQADPVIAAAGDIACDPAPKLFNDGKETPTDCRQLATSDLLTHVQGLTAVLILDDHRHETGMRSGFVRACEPSCGRLKHITCHTIGNHEGSGESYYRYFGSATGDPAKGIRAFIVGTGRKSHYKLGQIHESSEVRNNDTFDVLLFTLHSGSYEWTLSHGTGPFVYR